MRETDQIDAPTRLAVLILTYRRVDDLLALLPVVKAQFSTLPDVLARIIVIDNDVDASARSAVEGGDHGPTVTYVHEPTPGIAAARRRALVEASDDTVAVFLDDDLIPEPRWLAALVDMWQASSATAVLGHVDYHLVGEVDPIVAAGGFYRRAVHPTGTSLPTAATGNLLLDVAQVRELGVTFSPALGLAGGEDTLFSSQLVAAGGRIVFCAESVVRGDLGPDRADLAGALRRTRAHGGILVRNRLLLAANGRQRFVVRARAIVGGATRWLVGTSLGLVGRLLRAPRTTARGLRLSHRGRGMLQAGGGRVVEEYSRAH